MTAPGPPAQSAAPYGRSSSTRRSPQIWSQADALVQGLIGILAVYIFKLFVLPLMILGVFFVITRYFARLPRSDLG